LEYQFRGEFLIHASKKIDNEACENNKIDPDSVTTGAIIGKAILYDVKFYNNRNLFLQDKNKHLAETKYSEVVDCNTSNKIKNLLNTHGINCSLIQ